MIWDQIFANTTRLILAATHLLISLASILIKEIGLQFLIRPLSFHSFSNNKMTDCFCDVLNSPTSKLSL